MAVSVIDFAPADDVESAALGYFLNLVRRDMVGLEALLAADVIVESPYTPEGFGGFTPDVFHGREAIMSHFRVALENRRDHIFWIDQIYRPDDGETVIIEAHARSLVGETQRVYENSYVCIFTIRDSKIQKLREYANPLNFMKSFEGGFGSHN